MPEFQSPSLFELYAISRLGGNLRSPGLSRRQRQLFRKVLTDLGYLLPGTNRPSKSGIILGGTLKRLYEPIFFLHGRLDRTFVSGGRRITNLKVLQKGKNPVLFLSSLPNPSFNSNDEGIMYSFSHDFGEVEEDLLQLLHDLIYDGDDYSYDCWLLNRNSSNYMGRSVETLLSSLERGDRFHYVMTDRANWILHIFGLVDKRIGLSLRFYATNSELSAYVDQLAALEFKLTPLLKLTKQETKFKESMQMGGTIVVASGNYFDPQVVMPIEGREFKMSNVALLKYTPHYNNSRYIQMVSSDTPSEPTGVFPLDDVSPWLMCHHGGILDEWVRQGASFSLCWVRVLTLRDVVLAWLEFAPSSEYS